MLRFMVSFCVLGSTLASAGPRSPPPLVLPPSSPALDTGEGTVRILADKALTGGSWATLERTAPPGPLSSLPELSWRHPSVPLEGHCECRL